MSKTLSGTTQSGLARVSDPGGQMVNLILRQPLSAGEGRKSRRRGRRETGAPLGPLHGLPVAHKDLRETRGIRTTFGSPLYRDYIPPQTIWLWIGYRAPVRSRSARPT